MEEVGFTILLAICGLGGWGLKWRHNRRRDARRKRLAKWNASYESIGDNTCVLIRRVFTDSSENEHVLESVVFAKISEDDPEWENKFHQSMSEARSNAAARNSERTALNR